MRVFPAENLNTNGKLCHPWLDKDNLVIGSPGLNAFGSHSDLGRVVQAVKREFEKNPPTVIEANSIKTQSITNHSSESFFSSTVPKKHLTNVNLPTTDPRRYIPEVEQLSHVEIEEIKTDPLALDVFSGKLNVAMFSQMDEDAKAVRNEINALTVSNSQLCKVLDEKRQAFQDRFASIHTARDLTHRTAISLQESSEKLSQSKICDNLLRSCHNDEADSETCAETFLRGDMTAEEFLAEYVPLRSNYHKKKTTYDKLQNSHRNMY